MNDRQSLENRVTQLEELCSHQEHLLQQLNEVVLRIRAEHDRLAQRYEARVERLESLVTSLPATEMLDEKPPHY